MTALLALLLAWAWLEKKRVCITTALCQLQSFLRRTRAVDGTLPTCDVPWLSNGMGHHIGVPSAWT